MGWMDLFTGQKEEATTEDSLLEALLYDSEMTKEKALQVPTVRGCINKIAGTVSRLPIRLYRKEGDRIVEVEEDNRLKLLNRETGDELNADEFWRCMIEDYYMGKGGYAYIKKRRNMVESLHYVAEEYVSTIVGADHIEKQYRIAVDGKTFEPYCFLKIRRRARNGAESQPIWTENNKIFSIAYHSMVFEDTLVRKGGNKRGFIESENRLDKEAIESIKNAWRRMYSNNTDNVVVLNNGAKFKESSNTSVEMQLNENKTTNSVEICKLFGVPYSVLEGKATEADRKEFIATVMALINVIETALDKDLLLESEKKDHYFAFDTRELTRGDMKERYEAYSIALRSNFLQPDEVRRMEDMEELGLDFIKLGLNDVLMNPKTKEIYTPNTNQLINLKETEREKDIL